MSLDCQEGFLPSVCRTVGCSSAVSRSCQHTPAVRRKLASQLSREYPSHLSITTGSRLWTTLMTLGWTPGHNTRSEGYVKGQRWRVRGGQDLQETERNIDPIEFWSDRISIEANRVKRVVNGRIGHSMSLFLSLPVSLFHLLLTYLSFSLSSLSLQLSLSSPFSLQQCGQALCSFLNTMKYSAGL